MEEPKSQTKGPSEHPERAWQEKGHRAAVTEREVPVFGVQRFPHMSCEIKVCAVKDFWDLEVNRIQLADLTRHQHGSS